MRTAATHFQRAVEIDPEFALGHWGLAKLCGFQAQAGMLTPQQARIPAASSRCAWECCL
jgi:hypothetical protein